MSGKSRPNIYNQFIPREDIAYKSIDGSFITLPCVSVDVMGDRAQVRIVANKDKEYNHDVWLYTHWRGTELVEVVSRAMSREVRWWDAEYLTRIIFSGMVKNDIDGETGYGIGNHQHGDVYRVITIDIDKQQVTVDGWRGIPDETYSFEDFADNAFEMVSLP